MFFLKNLLAEDCREISSFYDPLKPLLKDYSLEGFGSLLQLKASFHFESYFVLPNFPREI